VDGGWFRLGDGFATAEECWEQLAPPTFDGARWDDLADRVRAGHRQGWPDGAAEAVLANLERTPHGGVRSRLALDRHRSIVESMYRQDPRAWFPHIDVPVLLAPAASPGPAGTARPPGRVTTVADEVLEAPVWPVPAAPPPESLREQITREEVAEALELLPRARVRWYPGAHHDLHLQHPRELAADLLDLARSVSGAGTAPEGGSSTATEGSVTTIRGGAA
jgi:pimeloyl-ACP methyl ester carboxylesterase